MDSQTIHLPAASTLAPLARALRHQSASLQSPQAYASGWTVSEINIHAAQLAVNLLQPAGAGQAGKRDRALGVLAQHGTSAAAAVAAAAGGKGGRLPRLGQRLLLQQGQVRASVPALRAAAVQGMSVGRGWKVMPASAAVGNAGEAGAARAGCTRAPRAPPLHSHTWRRTGRGRARPQEGPSTHSCRSLRAAGWGRLDSGTHGG